MSRLQLSVGLEHTALVAFAKRSGLKDLGELFEYMRRKKIPMTVIAGRREFQRYVVCDHGSFLMEIPWYIPFNEDKIRKRLEPLPTGPLNLKDFVDYERV